ncbi:MAG: hypothetical protein GH151_09485 [Bacteroidetes bacterium]|nr:hypothetical protein [Bacteroidota bacterium]
MNRRDFIKKMFKWCMLIFLAGLTAILGKKVVMKKVCSSCPDYASCPGLNSCEILLSK